MYRKKVHLTRIISLAVVTLLLSSLALLGQERGNSEIMFAGFAHLSQFMDGTPEEDIFSKKKAKKKAPLINIHKKMDFDMIMVELEPGEQKWTDSPYHRYNQTIEPQKL